MAAARDSKGRFIKGTGKTGGMKKGYVAPVKKELRQMMLDFSLDNYQAFIQAMEHCEPKDFCRYYLEALKFNVPLLQSVELGANKEQVSEFSLRLKAMSEKKEK